VGADPIAENCEAAKLCLQPPSVPNSQGDARGYARLAGNESNRPSVSGIRPELGVSGPMTLQQGRDIELVG
jgi:hypothetical protein